MKETPRFTLRKEYFGGLIYDSERGRVEILGLEDFQLLRKIAQTEEKIFISQMENNNRLEVFKSVGFIEILPDGSLSLVRTRLVSIPDFIPHDMLTAPIKVFDSITQFCNFECPQCYFSASNRVVEKRRTIEQTVEIMRKFFQAGTMEWRFTGGEPTTYPDLFLAIEEGKKMGMYIALCTNGWWSNEISKRIFESGLNEIAISIEGKEEINDSRRKKGSFRKAIESLERIREHNSSRSENERLKISIAVTVGRDNVGEIDFLVDLAIKYGADLNFMPLKPSGRARNFMGDNYLSTDEYMIFARKIQQARKRQDVIDSGIKIILKYKDLFNDNSPDYSNLPFPFNYSECGALTTAISMLPDGRVYSCPFVLEVDLKNEFMGPNMIDTTVYDAWFSPNFNKFRSAKKIGCVDCGFYMKQCRGFCRATVLGYGGKIEDGKLIGEDPQCFISLLKK